MPQDGSTLLRILVLSCIHQTAKGVSPRSNAPRVLSPVFLSIPLTANVAARAAAAESGRDGQKTVKADTFTGMSLEVRDHKQMPHTQADSMHCVCSM